MKHFKKRTIALVLASVITVAGSFAAGNYKNSLMSLKFNTAENGGVSMSVETKTSYSGNVTPVRRDANTYILTLSEMNSMVKGMPNLEKVSNDISSVEIKTLPYSNNAKGYTRVIIKTNNPVNIEATNKIYIPSKNDTAGELADNQSETAEEERKAELRRRAEKEKAALEQRRAERLQREQEAREEERQRAAAEAAKKPAEPAPIDYNNTPTVSDTSFSTEAEKDPYQVLMTVMAVLALAGTIAFFAVKASNKMQEITGEKIDIDTNDDSEPAKPKKEESKRKKIKNTIKQLDSAYSKTAVRPAPAQQAPVKTVKPAEELNVVDLDELFKEQQGKTKEDVVADVEAETEDENDALAEFLSGFSFDETEEEAPEETPGYDTEFYDKVIQDDTVKFSQDDIDCMNQLLNAEINDDTIRNIENYAATSPIKVSFKTQEEIMEDLVTTYKISQDISFNSDDIAALRKLISVEIDNDFLTDLRTNPERTKEMQREIEASRNKSRKPSEILTLSVKDMLPDLSEALRKQGGRKIESEVKPITVYASEGYEVSTLSLKDELPDLSTALNDKSDNTFKPSADWELVDNSYEVEKLSLSDSLPDLKDALKNPEKYEKHVEEPVKIDEESLLKNISNVQFKPFYDGSESFEIVNDFEAPSMDAIQNEFNQFGNFEISHEEEYAEASNNDYDDFESLYRNEYVDLDKMQDEPQEEESAPEITIEQALPAIKVNLEETKPEPEKKPQVEEQKPEPKPQAKEEFIPQKLERTKRDTSSIASRRVRTQLSDDIMKKIQETKAERIERQEKASQHRTPAPLPKHEEETQEPEVKCIIDGETYTIISTARFSETQGCHLAKQNKGGYIVLGFVGNKLIKLKEFDTLKSERITARLSEKLPENVSRYIVRIGLTKFIVNVNKDNIEYLMAL